MCKWRRMNFNYSQDFRLPPRSRCDLRTSGWLRSVQWQFLTDLFLKNQPDALIIQIYSVIKLYMFRASSLPIIRSSLLYIRHWQVSCTFLMTASKQSQDGTVLSKYLFCYKTLHVSGIFFAHHQEFCTVLSALVSFMQVFDDRFQAESGWNCSAAPSWLCLEAVIKNLHETCQCRKYCTELLMMGKEDARNM